MNCAQCLAPEGSRYEPEGDQLVGRRVRFYLLKSGEVKCEACLAPADEIDVQMGWLIDPKEN